MITKDTLIAVFVKKNKILSFLEEIKYKFKVNLKYVFIFQMKNNSFEFLVTFKTPVAQKCLKELTNAKVMHNKNGCMFSINALNMLIKNVYKENDSNFQIDWNLYHNKLMIVNSNELIIDDLEKIEDKSQLFFI